MADHAGEGRRVSLWCDFFVTLVEPCRRIIIVCQASTCLA